MEAEFRQLQRRRDAIGRDAEARLRNVRALGELAKFRLIPFGTVLSRLKVRIPFLFKAVLSRLTMHNAMCPCAKSAMFCGPGRTGPA